MKTQSITLQPPRRAGRALFVPRALFRSSSLPCLSVIFLVSALPAIALMVFAAWAVNAPLLLPVMQASVGMSGFVFLALAVDARRQMAVLLTATSAALFGLSLASANIAPELIVVGATVMAMWLGGGLFAHVRKRCL